MNELGNEKIGFVCFFGLILFVVLAEKCPAYLTTKKHCQASVKQILKTLVFFRRIAVCCTGWDIFSSSDLRQAPSPMS
jgi:hypothetical protein